MYTKLSTSSTPGWNLEEAIERGDMPENSLIPQDIADGILYVLSTPTRVKVLKIFYLKYIIYIV